MAYNPFDEQRDQAPTAALPAVPQQSQELPQAGKIADFLETATAPLRSGTGDDPNFRKVITSNIAQGVLNAAHGMYLTAADITDKLGLTKAEDTQKQRHADDSERAQVANLPYNLEHPTAASITQGVTESLPAMLAGTAAGGAALKAAGSLGGPLSQLLGGAISGGVAGGLQDPGQVDNPLLARLQNAGIGTAAGAALQAPISGLTRLLNGALTPEKAAAQTEIADQFNRIGATASVGQATGNPSVQGLESMLAKLPGVGGKSGYLKDTNKIVNYAEDFKNSLNQGDVGPLFEDVKNSIHPSMVTNVNPEGVFTAPNALQAAQDALKAVKEVGSNSTGAKAVMTQAQNILNGGPKNFQGWLNFKQGLGTVAFEGKPVEPWAQKALQNMAGGLRQDLGAVANKVSPTVGKAYDSANQAFQTSKANGLVQDAWDNAMSDLKVTKQGGPGLVSFIQNLEKKKEELQQLLPQSAKDTYGGLLNLVKSANVALNQIKPGPGFVSSAIGASMMGGAHVLGASNLLTGLGIGIKGMTFLLHSKAGQQLLTYVNRLKPGSPKAMDIARRFLSSASGAILPDHLPSLYSSSHLPIDTQDDEEQ